MRKFTFSLIAVISIASMSIAAVHRVPSVYTTIQRAVDAASEGDTILIADGTYTGAGNMDIELYGLNLVIISENGPEDCIIDLQSQGRAFFIHRGETEATVIEGLTISHGMTFNTGANRRQGGGILIDRASPTIRNCVFDSDSSRG